MLVGETVSVGAVDDVRVPADAVLELDVDLEGVDVDLEVDELVDVELADVAVVADELADDELAEDELPDDELSDEAVVGTDVEVETVVGERVGKVTGGRVEKVGRPVGRVISVISLMMLLMMLLTMDEIGGRLIVGRLVGGIGSEIVDNVVGRLIVMGGRVVGKPVMVSVGNVVMVGRDVGKPVKVGLSPLVVDVEPAVSEAVGVAADEEDELPGTETLDVDGDDDVEPTDEELLLGGSVGTGVITVVTALEGEAEVAETLVKAVEVVLLEAVELEDIEEEDEDMLAEDEVEELLLVELDVDDAVEVAVGVLVEDEVVMDNVVEEALLAEVLVVDAVDGDKIVVVTGLVVVSPLLLSEGQLLLRQRVKRTNEITVVTSTTTAEVTNCTPCVG